MLKQLRDASVELVRQRVSEGDCPVTPALSVETLENIVVELADEVVAKLHEAAAISRALSRALPGGEGK